MNEPNLFGQSDASALAPTEAACGWKDHLIRRVCRTGEEFECVAPLQLEHTVVVEINSVPTFRIVCSPDHIADLVIGRLFTEGIISCLADVTGLHESEAEDAVMVQIEDRHNLHGSPVIETVQTTGAGNKTLDNRFADRVVPRKIVPIEWKH